MNVTQSQRRLFPEPAETKLERCRRILADCARAGVQWKKPPAKRKRVRKATKERPEGETL